MSDSDNKYNDFVELVNEEEQVWALQNQEGEWVVCDSSEYEDADVMPIWGNADNAKSFCIDEWQDYQVASITLEDFLEEWISDLNTDGVLIGLDWQLDAQSVEMDPITVAKLIVKA